VAEFWFIWSDKLGLPEYPTVYITLDFQMPSDLPAQSIAAGAAIVAALVAGAFSFVNLTLTKEQKISEFRQTWIDALREDLATFFATARAFARATQELHAFGKGSKDGAPMAFTEDKISDLRYQIAETRYRIQLRLNPKEAEHIELLRLMQSAVDRQQEMIAGAADTTKILESIETAAGYAPQVLKTEWERVKKGELAFRLARNWIAPTIVLVSIGSVAMLWSGHMKI